MIPPAPTPGLLYLVARRTIAASPERVFSAWTDPTQLVKWWGPAWVSCPAAEVDLRPGGGFRIHNQLDDGTVLVIAGVYTRVEPPHRLDYSWFHEPRTADSEVTQVRVVFRPVVGGTEVILLHEGFGGPESRETHGVGWAGCLDGLEALLRG